MHAADAAYVFAAIEIERSSSGPIKGAMFRGIISDAVVLAYIDGQWYLTIF